MGAAGSSFLPSWTQPITDILENWTPETIKAVERAGRRKYQAAGMIDVVIVVGGPDTRPRKPCSLGRHPEVVVPFDIPDMTA